MDFSPTSPDHHVYLCTRIHTSVHFFLLPPCLLSNEEGYTLKSKWFKRGGFKDSTEELFRVPENLFLWIVTRRTSILFIYFFALIFQQEFSIHLVGKRGVLLFVNSSVFIKHSSPSSQASFSQKKSWFFTIVWNCSKNSRVQFQLCFHLRMEWLLEWFELCWTERWNKENLHIGLLYVCHTKHPTMQHPISN